MAFLATAAQLALRHALHLLTRLIPRRSNLWAFGSWRGGRFADNARYLFLYATTVAHDAPECVWISRRRDIVRQLRRHGLNAHHRWSPRGILIALRAGVYVFDCRTSDISYALSGGALRVNLWHGTPLKRIERDIEEPGHPLNKARRGSLPRRLFWHFWSPFNFERSDFMLATSSTAAAQFRTAFDLEADRVLVAGYPRNDALLGSPWTRRAASVVDRQIVTDLERDRSAGYRTVTYLPTWRDRVVVQDRERHVPLPLRELDQILGERRARLYCKFHFTDLAALEGIEDCRHVRLLPAEVDVYQYLSLIDALITDYSSIYFDYLLLDRPIVFYPHDLEEYRRLRTFYYEYDTVTPGPKAYTPEDLVSVLADLLSDYERAGERWSEERARVRAAAHRYEDDGASRRCLEQIRRLAEGS